MAAPIELACEPLQVTRPPEELGSRVAVDLTDGLARTLEHYAAAAQPSW